MAGTFQDIVTYFKDNHKHYDVDEEKQVLSAQFGGDSTSSRVRVQWNEELGRITYYIGDIVTVPEAKRDSACVLANLVNWTLAQGDLEIDMDDGEVAYKLAFYVSDGTLGSKQIGDNLRSALTVTDHCYPAFQRLLWSDLSPKEAFVSIED